MNGEVRFKLDAKDKQKICCVCVEGNNVILEYPEEKRKLFNDQQSGVISKTIQKDEIINIRISSGSASKDTGAYIGAAILWGIMIAILNIIALACCVFCLYKIFTSSSKYNVIKVYTSFHETFDLIFFDNETNEYNEALKLLQEVVKENQSSNQ